MSPIIRDKKKFNMADAKKNNSQNSFAKFCSKLSLCWTVRWPYISWAKSMLFVSIDILVTQGPISKLLTKKYWEFKLFFTDNERDYISKKYALTLYKKPWTDCLMCWSLWTILFQKDRVTSIDFCLLSFQFWNNAKGFPWA